MVGGGEGPPGTVRETRPPSNGRLPEATLSGSDSGYRTEESHVDLGKHRGRTHRDSGGGRGSPGEAGLGGRNEGSPTDSEATAVEGGPSALASDEQLAVDVLQELAVGRPQADDSLVNSSMASKDSRDGLSDMSDLTGEDSASTTMEEGESTVFYSYRSPPKSANSRHPGQVSPSPLPSALHM